MKRNEIAFNDFSNATFDLWAKRNLLLCAGDFATRDYNMMTVGWGSFGVFWGKPAAMVLVRPQRHTFAFIEKYETFTLTAFPESQSSALAFCGSKSGRDYPDKALSAGLTAERSHLVSAPSFTEAELSIECRKMYVTTFRPEGFVPPLECGKLYPNGDIHIVYYGEIVRIEGTERYLKP